MATKMKMRRYGASFQICRELDQFNDIKMLQTAAAEQVKDIYKIIN